MCFLKKVKVLWLPGHTADSRMFLNAGNLDEKGEI